ncbi:syntaxin-16-like protein [Spinellus fusiger]|nr:syntaxin-16-like protein [Spinellus fusiger]
MTTRSRTLVFLQYRNSYARKQGSSSADRETEREGLMESSSIIEMSVLPPQWVDVVEEVDDALEHIKEKISRLQGMHRKHLLPGFDDRSSDETAIEQLTSAITDAFYGIQRAIQRIPTHSHNSNPQSPDSVLAKNIQTSLATKVQDMSSLFRKQQSSYLQKVRGQEDRKASILGMDESSQEAMELLLDQDAQRGLTESQLAVLESNEALLHQREREVTHIAKSMHQLAEIFRDLQSLVIDQGSMLDRIDYNIEQTTVQVKQAVVELDKGESYMKKTRKRKLILLLILVILLLVVILIVKPR